MLDIAYAHAARNCVTHKDFERLDGYLDGTGKPEDMPQQEESEPLRAGNIDISALDSLDAQFKPPNIEGVTTDEVGDGG